MSNFFVSLYFSLFLLIFSNSMNNFSLCLSCSLQWHRITRRWLTHSIQYVFALFFFFFFLCSLLLSLLFFFMFSFPLVLLSSYYANWCVGYQLHVLLFLSFLSFSFYFILSSCSLFSLLFFLSMFCLLLHAFLALLTGVSDHSGACG